MPYLIDGNNFIGHIHPEDLRKPQRKQALIAQASIFQRLKKTKVYLVFDGPPPNSMEEASSTRKRFFVLYPSFSNNADVLIKEIISKQSDRRHFFVVSQDRDIRSFAKNNGAKVLSCKDFRRLLKEALKKYKKIQEMQKDILSPTPLEVTHWMEIFKGKT